MHPVKAYLAELAKYRSTEAASDEKSYYPALVNLLNAVGRTLSPNVICVAEIRDSGAGHPDVGLFTEDQTPPSGTSDGVSLFSTRKPSRGVVEVKPTSQEVLDVAKRDQVRRYWGQYNQVLVTNYRAFVLVGRNQDGAAAQLEEFELAPSAEAFWKLAKAPARAVEEGIADELISYLTRVLSHAAPITNPEDLAALLAAYAREALIRVEDMEQTGLDRFRRALEQALGLEFRGERGEHFFRSSLIQTLFYGVFSAWVLWARGRAKAAEDHFDWRTTAWLLRVPMVRALFEEIAKPSQLEHLGISETLDWTEAALDRVDHEAFFVRFAEEEAVEYFYEPFLADFDPQLRKSLGVWYTPREVVDYMVERVHEVLRSELGLDQGLADPRVVILDPACGTGAYLVSALQVIARTLSEASPDALTGDDLKRIAAQRVFGFEILPAPFVVAHLQMGLLLQRFGAPFSQEERAAVYLTNALTDWERGSEEEEQLLIPELRDEVAAARQVKREQPILVVLGNPPYNAFAGTSPAEEEGLVDPYKEGLISKWGIRKFNLDDLYVRFFRVGERRIVEMSGQGAVCYISNFSYLSDPSFVVMRERLLSGFDAIWIDCLNGDSRETGKLTPEGKPDPSIFSSPRNRVGIRKGTAIGLFVRRSSDSRSKRSTTVRYRDLWGVSKREELILSLDEEAFEGLYEAADPSEETRFSFRPLQISANYLSWPKAVELCAVSPSYGLMEKRKGALIGIDRDPLESRMRMYYDDRVRWDELSELGTGLTVDAARFDARGAREKVSDAEEFHADRVRRYAVRPFDNQWCYYSPVRPLWNEPRPQLWEQAWPGNQFLLTRFKRAKTPEGPPFYFTGSLSDDHLLSPDAVACPFWLGQQQTKGMKQVTLLDAPQSGDKRPNLSEKARSYLAHIGEAADDTTAASLIWFHVLAIGYSPAYLIQNADGIGQDWPRIPLPRHSAVLKSSSELGRALGTLLDTDDQLGSANAGTLLTDLRLIGIVSCSGGGTLSPESGDLRVSADWGRPDSRGAVMPGPGSIVERDFTTDELDVFEIGASDHGMSLVDCLGLLGETTYDIYLNERAYWRNVPRRVWEYTIRGYQVLKKWLSYRDHRALGRDLHSPEAREVGAIARRIAAVLLMGPLLNANYVTAARDYIEWSAIEPR